MHLEVWLAEVSGIRKHTGGRFQPRLKTVASNDPAQIIRVERARYATTEITFRRFIQNHFRNFTDGSISYSEFYDSFSKELYRFEVRMYMLGRRVAGNYSNQLSEGERKLLHGRHATEMRFFNGFLRDYLQARGKMPYAQRLDLYALDGYGLYTLGAIVSLPNAATERFDWLTNPEAEHCDDCIYREAKSKQQQGFTLSEILEGWVGIPGQKTKCGNRCRCGLKCRSGRPLPLMRTQSTAFAAHNLFPGKKIIRRPKGEKGQFKGRGKGSAS